MLGNEDRSNSGPVSGEQVSVSEDLAEPEPQLALLVARGDALDLRDVDHAGSLPGEIKARLIRSGGARLDPGACKHLRKLVLSLGMPANPSRPPPDPP